MTKQPVLTGFPCSVFATAKRRLQAAMRRARAGITRDSLSGYAVIFADILPGDFLESADPTLRQRSFGHIPVFWAWLAQILEANASCQRAVGFIQSWCRTCGLSVPSSDTSSYCKARLRVDIRFLHAIHRRIRDHLGARISGADRWQGFNLVAMDGSSVQLRDTAANQRAYPQPSGQKPGCGFPTMGIVGLVNLCHGGWEQVVACPHTRHDSRAAGGLIAHLHAGDLLLADRAFCSYELIARCQGRGAHALMRLHQARAKSLDWREGKRISAYERIVTWTRPQRPPGSGLSPAEWEALPASMELRLIKVRYENRAGEKGELIVVTTLTDPSRHCGMELADLYARRWDIELKLRDLKTTMGMERFDVNTPEMAQKTLLMGVIAFNLIRSVMQRAADRAGEPTRHMSFKGTLDLVAASHESFREHAGRPLKRAAAMDALVATCATKRIYIRPFRKEPRAVKRRPKPSPFLTRHRSEYGEIHHRNPYRKPA